MITIIPLSVLHAPPIAPPGLLASTRSDIACIVTLSRGAGAPESTQRLF